jgi:fructokinase
MMTRILSLGEVLWDALPEGLFLGGAPFNVACHMRALGLDAHFASCVGDDELGREIRRRLSRKGIDDHLLQTQPDLPTGFVVVELSSEGVPTFEILAPSAWDAIQPTAELLDAARAADAIVYGTLAQRSATTRATLRQLWGGGQGAGRPATGNTATLFVYDVNFRPPFVEQALVEESLHKADIVKLNDAELEEIGDWCGFPNSEENAARELSRRFKCRTVCVTRGQLGAALLHDDEWYEDEGFRVEVADTVGAGDAFLAALMEGLFKHIEPAQLLRRANAVGAFVASRRGATPEIDEQEIEGLLRSRG